MKLSLRKSEEMQTNNLIPSWLLKENAKRTSEYKRDSDDENFLYSFNTLLESFEKEIEIPDHEPFPFLYVVGVPRAGKTLFSQVLSHGLDVGYIDNVISKFWKAPCYGIKLSNILRNYEKQIKFTSDYGKTKGVFGPHDFSYFWHNWLNMNKLKYNPIEAAHTINWVGLRNELKRISFIYNRPGIFKSPNPTYHIAKISNIYKKSIWLHIERDFIDSAISLLKGRRDNFGDVNEWYGQYPFPYKQLLELPYAEQIVSQIVHLTKMYNQQFEQIDPRQIVKISYRKLCESPKKILKKIINTTEEFTGYRINFKHDLPEQFVQSLHDENSSDYNILAQAFDQLKMPKRF